MAVNIITNKGKTNQAPYGASLHPFEWIQYIADTTADVARISFGTLWRPGFQIGPTIQNGKNGTTQLYLTLDDPDVALDPAKDSQVAWFTSTNLIASQLITLSPTVFTVMKAVFTLSGASANALTIGSL